mgnify:CR=1 FL=1
MEPKNKNTELKIFNIVAIVNEGYSDLVMDVAKELGARGGTIIPANGSVSSDAMKLYGIGIHPEKEIALILVKEELVTPILKSLYEKAGSSTDAKGIFFTLPVSHVSDNVLKQYTKPEQEK